MKIVNRSRYPTSTVERIVHAAMGKKLSAPSTSTWLTVTITNITGATTEGKTTSKHGVVHTWIGIGPESEYPRTQRHYKGNPPYTLNSWREGLYHSAAHESWHVWHGSGERPADRYATLKLFAARLKKLVGVNAF